MTTTVTTMLDPRLDSGSGEGKRNKKTRALNALLSATALGLFLEGCQTRTSSRSCTLNGVAVDCSHPAFNAAELSPQGNGQASAASVTVSTALPEVAESEGDVVASSLANFSLDDLFEGSSAIETFDGGEGADTVSYTSSDSGVEVDLSKGRGEIGDAEGDTYVDIENIVGSPQDDDLTGSVQANIIEGTSGNDVLTGGAGADTYVFSEGDGEDTIIEVAEDGVVNTLKFEGDYQASDFSFERSSEDSKDLVITADTDGDGQAENKITLEDYFVTEEGTETAYSIEVQINDEEAFVPSVE